MQVLSAPLRAGLFFLNFVFGIAAWIKSCLTLSLLSLSCLRPAFPIRPGTAMQYLRIRFCKLAAPHYLAILSLAVAGCGSTPEYKIVRDADIDAQIHVVDEQGKPLKGIDVWRLVDPIPQVNTQAPPQRSLLFAYLDRVAERYRHLAEFARPWRPGFIAAVESELKSLPPSDTEGRAGEVIKFMGGRTQTVSLRYTALGYGYYPAHVQTELAAGRNRLTLKIVLRRDTDIVLPTAAYWQKYLDIQREFSKSYERNPEDSRTELMEAARDAEKAGDRKIAARIYSWIPFLPTLMTTDELRGGIRVSGYTREDEFSTRNVALLETAAALDPENRYIRMKLLLVRPPTERDSHLRKLEALVSGGRADLWPEVFERLETTYLAAGQRDQAKKEFDWFAEHEPADWRNRDSFAKGRSARYVSLDEFFRLYVGSRGPLSPDEHQRDALSYAVFSGRVDLVDWLVDGYVSQLDVSRMIFQAIQSRRPEMVRRVLEARAVAQGPATPKVDFELRQVDLLITGRKADLADIEQIRRLLLSQSGARERH